MWNKNIENALRELRNTILKELSSHLLKMENGKIELKQPFEITPGEFVLSVYYQNGRIIVVSDTEDVPEENDLELYGTDEMVKIAKTILKSE